MKKLEICDLGIKKKRVSYQEALVRKAQKPKQDFRL
jgi:hypothetical protein